MCRARVKLMLGAWRALAPDAQALLANPSVDAEHFRWMDEYSQVMKQWIGTFERDLEEYGTPKEADPPGPTRGGVVKSGYEAKAGAASARAHKAAAASAEEAAAANSASQGGASSGAASLPAQGAGS